jgi:hypothetical protein
MDHPLCLELWRGLDLATPGAVDHELHEAHRSVFETVGAA